MTIKQVVQVEGKSLQLSNLEKVLWPGPGLTKADLLDYHAKLSTLTNNHWRGRALTVTRYPHGIEEEFFFQKNSPSSAPAWVRTHEVETTNYVVAGDLATTSWLVNGAAIEFHPSTYLISKPKVPSYAIIDLDPTPPQGFREAVEIAKYCHDILQGMGLYGYPKLSGGSGIHVYIPLVDQYDFSTSAELVRIVGVTLETLHPEKVTLERLIKKRRGVYVDYLQNHPGKTMIGVYSPRPTPEATVSTPVRWDDLDKFEPRDFTVRTVPKWVRERGDLFDSVLSHPRSLKGLAPLVF